MTRKPVRYPDTSAAALRRLGGAMHRFLDTLIVALRIDRLATWLARKLER